MNIVRPNFETKTKPKKYLLEDLKDGECFMYYHTRCGVYIKGTDALDGGIVITNLKNGETDVECINTEVIKIRTLLILNVEEEED